jgi:hypothetical protein
VRSHQSAIPRHLGLHAGEEVEVRSAEEILSTLDSDGSLENLPFMPEMLQYAGRRFRVSARAHKACDTINKTGCRSMPDAVHLEGLRCDGGAHGGCEARCLLYWKEAWLKRVGRGTGQSSPAAPDADGYSRADLEQATRRVDDPDAYSCQATALFDATAPMRWWDPRHYLKDLWYGNVGIVRFLRVVGLAAFNVLQRRRGGRQLPVLYGKLDKTPKERLDLEVGELVQVKSGDEIMATLDKTLRNRGLLFDKELLPYCGKTYRVAARVEQIVNEKTGRMMRLPNDCVILEGVACQGIYSRNRLFCPRAILPYWREIWLRRTETEATEPRSAVAAEE